MKRIGVLFLGLFFVVFAFATTYSLESVINSRITINETDYDCSKTSDALDLPQDIGNISAIIMDAACSAYEEKDVAAIRKTADVSSVKYYYSFDKSNWTSVLMISSGEALIPVDQSSRSTPYANLNNNIDLSGFTNGEACTLYVYFEATEGATVKTDPVSDPTVNPYEAYFTRIADISFTDGSAFTPSITPGNENELIGRFQLEADVSGAYLTDASIDLSGSQTGFTNFELWASSDASYDAGDTQLGSTIETGSSPAAFSSFSLEVPTEGTYILLTADVAEDATGSIQGIIGESADLTVTDGEINETIVDAYMSNGGAEIPMPVELASFTAESVQGRVELNWTTESETENSHFLVYRDGEVIAQVEGAGTSSETHRYKYTDTQVRVGNYSYAIADVSYGGVVEMHESIEVEVKTEDQAMSFQLNKAYPNPFNPLTTVDYCMARGMHLDLGVYNTQGEKVANIYNGLQSAGTHSAIWDASGFPSGIYFVRMMAGDMVQTMKIVLMK